MAYVIQTLARTLNDDIENFAIVAHSHTLLRASLLLYELLPIVVVYQHLGHHLPHLLQKGEFQPPVEWQMLRRPWMKWQRDDSKK